MGRNHTERELLIGEVADLVHDMRRIIHHIDMQGGNPNINRAAQSAISAAATAATNAMSHLRAAQTIMEEPRV